jgi:chromosome transmission fidelity protein 1
MNNNTSSGGCSQRGFTVGAGDRCHSQQQYHPHVYADFPFSPYPQQQQLMSSLYGCMKAGGVGLFESPTGTGKSLSTLFAAIAWLREEEEARLNSIPAVPQSSSQSSSQSNSQSSIQTAQSTATVASTDDDWLKDFFTPPSTVASITTNTSQQTSATSSTSKSSTCSSTAPAPCECPSSSQSGRANALKRLAEVKERINSRKSLTAVLSQQSQTNARLFHKQSHSHNGANKDGNRSSADHKRIRYDNDNDNDNNNSDDEFGIDPNTKDWREDVDEEEEEVDEFFRFNMPQVIYCSRTHSQLAQFVHEVKKSLTGASTNTNTPMPRVVVLGGRRTMCIHSEVQKLKHNDAALTDTCLKMQKHKDKKPAAVKSSSDKLQSADADVRKNKQSKENDITSNPCPYKQAFSESLLSDYLLANTLDIEEVVSAAHKLHACPYYSTRKALKYAQIVCMPYNFLLSADIRESIGLSLHNRVVILDEAHNIIDVCNALHSAEVSVTQLELCKQAVDAYLMRFRTRLSGTNSYNLTLLQSVINNLLKCAQKLLVQGQVNTSAMVVEATSNSTLMSVNDFVFAAGLDNVNCLQLRRYVNDNNLVNKISGFMEHTHMKGLRQAHSTNNADANANPEQGAIRQDKKHPKHEPTGHGDNSSMGPQSNHHTSNPWNPALRNALDLIRCLSTSNADGRVVFDVHGNANISGSGNETTATIKFILLNPSVPFESIVQQAHSVCLVGGTMQPFNYYGSQLFPSLPLRTHTPPTMITNTCKQSTQLQTFSCGHVIAATNVKPLLLGVGPSGKQLILTHQYRTQSQILDELLNVLLHIGRVTPHGVVVFFTSYQYMETCIQHWKQGSSNHFHRTSSSANMTRSTNWNALEEIKTVFIEPKQASDCDSVLSSYAAAIATTADTESLAESKRTGAVLFSVMGGKLSEGINFSDSLARCVCVVGLPYPDKRDKILQLKLNHYAHTVPPSNIRIQQQQQPSLYDVLCMRSVNQSIGRAIRHARDYAAMVLIDTRYCGHGPHHGVQELLPGWIRDQLIECDSFDKCLYELHTFFATHHH